MGDNQTMQIKIYLGKTEGKSRRRAKRRGKGEGRWKKGKMMVIKL